MERRRHAWFAGFLVASSVFLTAAQCPFRSSSTDELIDLAVASSDETRALIAKEANALGSSEDEVAKPWVSRFEAAKGAYDGVNPRARALACDAVTQWVGQLATPQTDDDLQGAYGVSQVAAGMGVSEFALKSDLDDAVLRYQNDEIVHLRVLIIQGTVCKAAG